MLIKQIKVKIKDGVAFDGQDYSGLKGVTNYQADNGIWWIDLDKESTDKFSYEYKQMCKHREECFDAVCLEENDFDFID